MSNIKRILSKLMIKIQGNSLYYLKKLENWQWMDWEQIPVLQEKRLKDLLIHSYNHVPYYRQILSSVGVVEKNSNLNLKNFRQIPLLDKDTIRSQYEKLKSDDLGDKKWFEDTSGGSTGEPVRFIQDRNYADWRDAVKMLFDQWTGYSLGQTKLMFWGSERDVFFGKEIKRIQARRWLLNHTWVNSFALSPRKMHLCVLEINRLKPANILAYAESLYELALFIKREGIEVYSPSAIMTSAGMLTQPMREVIEKVFKTPVFNRYGSREVGDVACECDHHTGLHICSPTHYVEILMENGSPTPPGEQGEIVITSLTNYTMPIIRYRIGDMGVWSQSPCSCGRTWPLLKEVVGRVTDIFINKTGQLIDGRLFNTFLWGRPFVEKYQIVQEDYDFIRVLIVSRIEVDNPYDHFAEELNEIIEKIIFVMGHICKVEFEFHDNIAPTTTGKHRYTISKVKRQ